MPLHLQLAGGNPVCCLEGFEILQHRCGICRFYPIHRREIAVRPMESICSCVSAFGIGSLLFPLGKCMRCAKR